MSFNFSESTEVQDTPQGIKPSSGFDFSSSKETETDSSGKTPYEKFKLSSPRIGIGDSFKESKVAPSKPINNTTGGGGGFSDKIDFPSEDALNATIHSARGAMWQVVDKPILGKKDEQFDQYLQNLEKEHPIANIIGGTAPYIASAMLFPEVLLPNIWGRMAVQFGAVGALQSIGKERVDEPEKPLLEKAKTVAVDTAKQVILSPIFAKAQALEFVDRPFASALARAGFIGTGTGIMSAVFGENIVEAFKQGGTLGAFSLIMESPHLAFTAMGRGVISSVNPALEKKGLPTIDVDNPKGGPVDVAKKVEELPKEVKENIEVVKPPEPKIEIDHPVEIPLQRKTGNVERQIRKISDGTYQSRVRVNDKEGNNDENFGSWFKYDISKEDLSKWKTEEQLKNEKKDIDIPEFKGTEPAVDFGYKNKDNPEVLNALKQKRELTLAETEKLRAKENRTDEEDMRLLSLGTKAQFYREALEAAEGKITPERIAKIKERLGIKEPITETPKSQGVKSVFKIRLGQEWKIFIGEQGKGKASSKKMNSLKAINELRKQLTDIEESGEGEYLIIKGFPRERTLQDEVHDAAVALSKDIKGADKSHIISAVVKLNDGTELDGASHEDALNKAGLTKDTHVEDRDFKAGFRVLDPDGKTRFITRDQAQKEFGISSSEEVKGLNQTKFMSPDDGLKIVNPETLEKIKGQEGKIDIHLLAGVPETGEFFKNSYDELKKNFVPPNVSDPAKFTAMSLRQWLGIMARNKDKFSASMEKARRLFEKASKESIIETYTKAERGEKQSDTGLQKIYDVLQKTLEDKAKIIQERTGRLQDLIENYLPHAWEQPNKAKNILARIFGRRPFEGSKAFLKKRTIKDFETGIKAGLTPFSWNPVDLTMFKLTEMDRFLAAFEVKESLKENGMRKFVRPGGEVPDGWVKIKDRGEDVYSKNDDGELVLRGSYYTHPDAARIIDNYLSPGLRGNWFYDIYRSAGNSLIQSRLSFSAFHAQFVTNDTNISSFALGLNRLFSGDVKGAFKELPKGFLGPIKPINTFLEGKKVWESWHGKDNGELTNLVADLYSQGGGRSKMDRFWAIESDKAISKAFKEGKYLTGVLHTPFWIIQQVNRPLMEYVVPRMKMGVFSDIMKFELEKNPNVGHEELLMKAQKAVDTVDDRMGQLVYDNLFINRTLKDLGMASVQSLGWNIGDVRLFGGGAIDLVKELNSLRQGKGSELSYRLAYVLSMPIIMGYYGAIYQYLHTGKKPGDGIEDEGISGRLKDLFFPRNGGIDKRGKESRINLASYVKDIYHFSEDPVRTIINKLNPIHSTIIDMIQNKDYYGTEIFNEDDPLMQQMVDRLNFLVSSNLPYSIQNMRKQPLQTTGSRIESFFGFVPAPYDVNMTPAEKKAYELSRGHIPVGTRTKDQAKRTQEKSQLRSDYMTSGDESILKKSVSDGVITKKEKEQIIKESKLSGLERMTQHLTVEEIKSLYKKADDKERSELDRILKRKRANKKERGTWTAKEEEMFKETYGQ